MKTDLLRLLIQDCPDLESLLALIDQDKSDYWLVGGCLRDLTMDRMVNDIDLASHGNPTDLAKKWSSQIGGRWFWLDKERLQSRVLLKSGLHVDFSPLRAPTLEQDLELRDFTINSMAIACDKPECLVDPFNGMGDISKGCLRPTSDRSFTDDPLRMLKGVRHAVSLDMVCPPETIQAIKKHAASISNISGERIRSELIQILGSDDPVSGLDLLWKGDLLPALFALQALQSEEQWLCLLDDLAQLCVKLKEFEQQWFKAIALLLPERELDRLMALYLFVPIIQFLQPQNLSALLHKRLRFSRYEQRLVESLIHLDDSFSQYILTLDSQPFERIKALIVEQLEPCSLEKMLYVGLFDSHIQFDQCIDFYQCFLAWQKKGRVPNLISGAEVQQLTACSDGALIGDWHKKLKAAEIAGEITTVGEAEEWLKKQNSI